MAYSAKVMDHFANPRNVGEMKDYSGVGEVGNPKCGDIMRMYIKVEGCLLYTSGGRKASAPAISQTAAQVQAIKAQQEAQEKRAARKGRGSRSKKAQKPPIKVYFLGGLNEIGKNFTLYECQGDMVDVYKRQGHAPGILPAAKVRGYSPGAAPSRRGIAGGVLSTARGLFLLPSCPYKPFVL